MPDRRLIEETFPVKEVSDHSAREKAIRHGHISTLHIWWARRPLAASRATALAALLPAPADILEWQNLRNFLADLSRWENSLNPLLLERARRMMLAAHAERLRAGSAAPEDVPPPRVLDPFAGGGSYPLEALRLGCEAHAGDYNPVAVLILKATLEYPQQYGRPFPGVPEHLWRRPQRKTTPPSAQMRLALDDEPPPDAPLADFNPLLAAVRYWGAWVLEEARRELASFYPPSPSPSGKGGGGQGGGGEVPVGYIWARTLPCQNPACGTEIPLMRQFWLAKKPGREIALCPQTDGPGGPVSFQIVARGGKVGAGAHYAPWPSGFDPSRGTVKGAVVTCPACGAALSPAQTRRLFQDGRAGQRMVAVVTTPSPHPPPSTGEGRGGGSPSTGEGRGGGSPSTGEGRGGGGGKRYRLPTDADREAFRAACAALEEKRAHLRAEWGMEPVPDEPLPPQGTLGFRVQGYGISTWGDLFNPRQQLALITFAEKVRQAHARMRDLNYPEDFARAVTTYLALAISRLTDRNSVLCRVIPQTEAIGFTFARQALPMLWDYIEMNPLRHSSGWPSLLEDSLSNIAYLTRISPVEEGTR